MRTAEGMISHHHTTIFLSRPRKCPAVLPPKSHPQPLSVIVSPIIHHHHPLVLASKKEVAGPALFLQQLDEYEEESRRGSSMLSSSSSDSGDSEATVALEAEIMDFMLNSPKPNAFPTKKELISAGRVDLAEAIATRGGWLAYGWDLDEEDCTSAQHNGKINGKGSHSVIESYDDDDFFVDDTRILQSRFTCSDSSDDADSTTSSSSSGGSIGREGGEDMGIEGILSRLQKERSSFYGIGSREKQSNSRKLVKNGDNNQREISNDVVGGRKRCSGSGEDLFSEPEALHFHSGNFSDFNVMRSSLKPETWRMWSILRAGSPATEFEAAEIVPHDSGQQRTVDSLPDDVAVNDEMCTVTENMDELESTSKEMSDDKENFRNQIHSRLQRLQSELTSVLHLLRSGSDAVASDKDQIDSQEELHRLSDAWEFQETEIMKARDKLRSIRAKLAVLEGKMALELIEAQKIMEERQRRIDDAQKALYILRTACIVWPSSASEVFVAGSFDGWTSQRRMERSTSGIFSLSLKLYPGRYEIKFIVDGIWRIDPLRPVVHNNGHENNLLIVS